MSTAIIFGAGPNVGVAVAKKFLKHGYNVVTVTRSPLASLGDNHRHVAADLSDPSSVSGVFEKTRAFFGEPNLVVYNANAHIAVDKNDGVAPPVEEFAASLNINTISLYAAVHEAVKSFDNVKAAHKTFIYTGNLLNKIFETRFLALGVGKRASEYVLQLAQQSYGHKGFNFYFSDEREADGSNVAPPGADSTADFYYSLAEGTAGNVPVLHNFVGGIGHKDFAEAILKL